MASVLLNGIGRTACELHVWFVAVSSAASPSSIYDSLIISYIQISSGQTYICNQWIFRLPTIYSFY